MGIDEILEVIEEEDYDVTLTGGDPLYNPDFVICLADRIHSLGHNIWLYTGFTWEEILNSHALYDAVSHIDVIADSLLFSRKEIPTWHSEDRQIRG